MDNEGDHVAGVETSEEIKTGSSDTNNGETESKNGGENIVPIDSEIDKNNGNVPSEVPPVKASRSCCKVNGNSEECSSSGSRGVEEFQLPVKSKEEKEKRECEASECAEINDKCDNKASTSFSEVLKTKRGISEDQEEEDDLKMGKKEESRGTLDTDSSKRQKTEESTRGSLIEELPAKFHKLKSKVRKRNYRVKKNLNDDDQDQRNADDPIDGGSTNSSGNEDMDTGEAESRISEGELLSNANDDSNPGREGAVENLEEAAENDGGEESKENSEGDSEGQDKVEDDDSNEWTSASDDDSDAPIVAVLSKEKPKPQWFVIPELLNRELGSNRLFQRRFYGSLHTVQRLGLLYKLKKHKGCVNTLSFNQRGNLLASGSDDLMVIIWDWALGKKQHSFRTGHRSNVFQASWLPLPSESLMVTCARDGQVRLADLNKTTGDCTRRLATHEGPATKLAIHPDLPHVILSAGEDARIFSIDVRQNKPTVLLTLLEGNSQVAIYSVNSNPLNSNEFCIGGRDQFVRIYDKRKVSSPLQKMCPKHLRNNTNHVHVTSVKYNYNGSEVVASYNDEDIYLFDTIIPALNSDFVHRYQGHRNSATVKGVNFFGPKSEFVISGSDCSNIFIWEKNTESIVKWMAGDEHGVVNRLEPHPHIPVLATSGLDHDVKIWVPSCEEPPSMTNLETCVRENMKSRERDISREPNPFDGQLLWFLWRHARQSEVPRSRVRRFGRVSGDAARNQQEEPDTSSSDTSNPSNSASEDESDARPQCSPS